MVYWAQESAKEIIARHEPKFEQLSGPTPTLKAVLRCQFPIALDSLRVMLHGNG